MALAKKIPIFGFHFSTHEKTVRQQMMRWYSQLHR
jgi:hypothetical protein